MEKLQYYVPEHIESLPRLKAHYRVGISNAERCTLWKELLGTNQASEEVVNIDESTLTQRDDVRVHCESLKFINQCPNTAETQEELAKKLQTLILYYLQQNPTRPYHPRLMQAAFPFLAIGLSLEDAYRCFICFLKIFLPKFFTEDKKVLQSKADLLRLLILYHDPALCYYMDQRGVSPVSYVQDWWSVLFYETCTDLTTVLTLWDNIFLAWDPYLYMFISLVLIMRTREQILAGEAQEIPLLVSTTQIGDFTEVSRLVQQALSFSEITPHAFRCQLCDVTHQSPLFFEFLHAHLKTALCLSVGVQDVVVVVKPKDKNPPVNTDTPAADAPQDPSTPKLDSNAPLSSTPPLTPTSARVRALSNSAHRSHTRTPSSADEYPKFAQDVYDCRSLREYNCGHLPGSVHLDPEKLLNRLGNPQHSSKHIALLPRAGQSGDEQALILRLLQCGIPYVSCISSGYEVCHSMFKEGRIYLENHNEAGCYVCTGISPPLSTLASLTFTPSHQPEQPLLLPPEQMQELSKNQHAAAQHIQTSHQPPQRENSEKGGLSSIFGGAKISQMMKDTSASLVSGSKKLAENVGHINISMNNIKSMLPRSGGITNEEDEQADEEVDVSGLDASDYRSLQEWMMYDTNEQFPCKQVKKDGTLVPRRLILNDKELIVLEVSPTNPTYVKIKKTYKLEQISQITYKKSKPKILSFKLEVPLPASPLPGSSVLSPAIGDPTPSLAPSTPPRTSPLDPPAATPPFRPAVPNEFQEITLSPSGPPTTTTTLSPSTSSPASHPLATNYLKINRFYVGEPTLLIDAVHRKVRNL